MNFTKFQNKLTSEEIHFFEKIFEDKEVKENFKYNNKKFQKYFICFYILSSISFISIIVGAFLESKNTIFISFALFLFFIILGIFLQKTNNKWILKNYQISQIIFKKIFELFSSNGNYKNPNWEELLKKNKKFKSITNN